jgi:DNA-binding transcriptional ArsR family regulator
VWGRILGELVAGKPALRLNYIVSLPLDLVSAMALLYRAVPGSGLDPVLIAMRRALSPELRAELDLLHGFSGRMLYYMEEPVLAFDPLRPDRLNATFEDLIDFLEELPGEQYVEMALSAVRRVHRDTGLDPVTVPASRDREAWRTLLTPGQTTADLEQAVDLVTHPTALKRHTVDLFRGVWEAGYGEEFARREASLRAAASLAAATEPRGAALAFGDLTGNRMPVSLAAGLGDVERIVFCPSWHLGSYVSFIHNPPDLVVYFGAPQWLERMEQQVEGRPAPVASSATNGGGTSTSAMDQETLLDALRALGDPNRLHILDLLAEGELYAQEIVGRLGIAQSAVSRHLSLLERSGLVRVRPRGGMKYYAVDQVRLDAVAERLRCCGKR